MLKTNYKDDIFSGARKYRFVNNSDGTISLIDVTNYTQIGDSIGAAELNEIGEEVNGKSPSNHTHGNMTGATASANGKAGFVPAPEKGASNRYLCSDGTWAVPPNTTYSAMIGATASAAGTSGLVPAPASGAQGKYLRGDGTWQTPPGTTYSEATTSASGLMSAADKAKLNGIAPGAQVNAVTGIKGNAETSYRTGNVNLTPANIGAATATHTHNYAGSSSAGGPATTALACTGNAATATNATNHINTYTRHVAIQEEAPAEAYLWAW